MTKEEPEPIERLEEIVIHPADKTFTTLHDKSLLAKKELSNERDELAALLAKLPSAPPKPHTKEHQAYQQTQSQIRALKGQIAKKHDELMEILKTEERISREIQEKGL